MKKRMTIMIIALIIVFGGIFGFDFMRGLMINKFMSSYKPPPTTIAAATIKAETWTPAISAIGTLTAYNGVNISPQQSGQINKIYFKSGQLVKKGQALIGQDISEDEQTLKNQEASYQYAKVSYTRQLELVQRGNFASKSALDQAKAKMDEAQADMNKTNVIIAQKTIRAPFSGRIGIRQANLGQYITPSDTLTSLQQLNPLRALFSTPEQNITALYVGQPITLTVDAFPGKTFTGKITALNSEINSSTRNLKVEANIPNQKLQLYPGMFANIKVELPKKTNVLTIPQTAIAYSLYGDSVFLLKKTTEKIKNEPVYLANRVYINTGDMRGNQVAITSNKIKVGDQVVSAGQLKLQSGSRVVINNSVTTNVPDLAVDQES